MIDDLTNEALDVGSGPSEGAARDVRDWFGDLVKPAVGPKAAFDHITRDPWWEPYVDWHPAYRYSNTSSEECSDDSPESLTALPSSTEVGVVTPDADGVIRMSIAPGETRTARVQLPGLTLDLTITMPR